MAAIFRFFCAGKVFLLPDPAIFFTEINPEAAPPQESVVFGANLCLDRWESTPYRVAPSKTKSLHFHSNGEIGRYAEDAAPDARGQILMRIPVTIVSGYLGAGKTTLVNSLLREDHALKLSVLVNDFGSINIDAALIEGAEVDSIALTNGCVCCSLGDDLAQSVNAILTRDIRPDHILIEASGVADPVAIANTLLADRRLSYAGIVTVVDGSSVANLLSDPLLAPQVGQQIRAADLVLLSKLSEAPSEALLTQLRTLGARTPTRVDDMPLSKMLFDITPLPRDATPVPHPGYVSWQHRSSTVLDRRALGDKLADRPEGLYRMKGFVLTSGGAYELHIVGRHVEARRCDADETLLVALGPEARISRDQIETWWTGA